jgi:GntR family transcriptional regulator
MRMPAHSAIKMGFTSARGTISIKEWCFGFRQMYVLSALGAQSSDRFQATMSSKPAKSIRQPRYAWLRECLLNDINRGKYPVGSLLPAENQLAETYGVSRQTVREATRKLADSGLIARHPGIGTVVCAEKTPAPYIAALGSLQELFEYTSTTRLELLSHLSVTAGVKLAESLGCEPGSIWAELRARRYATDQAAPISFTKVYLRSEFSGIKDRLRGQHQSIYTMLERYYGQTIHAVKQEIEATVMPAEAAKLLDVKARSPALHMRRSYSDKDGRLLAVSSNLFAADRFRLITFWDKVSEQQP